MIRAAEASLLKRLRTAGHSPGRDRTVARFSAIGEHGSVWLALALAGAVAAPRRRRDYLRAGGTVAAAYAANQCVKVAVRRPRPRLEGLPPLTGTLSQLSYPSAHASTSTAGARALSPLLPAAPLWVLAAALALSRLYLGVHHPTDTLAGAALGGAVAELAR